MSEGYGFDSWCFDELQTGRMVSGAELVAQAIYRRLTTPRGTLRGGEEESVYGLDLLDFVGQVGSQAALDALPDVVEAEVLKDDRVLTCDVECTPTTDTDGTVAIVMTVTATLRDDSDQFILTLSVDDVSVTVVGVTV